MRCSAPVPFGSFKEWQNKGNNGEHDNMRTDGTRMARLTDDVPCTTYVEVVDSQDSSRDKSRR